MDSEDGEFFVKQLASFVRTHEKALANALQFQRRETRHRPSQSTSSVSTIPKSPSLPNRPATSSSASTLAATFSLGALNLTSNNVKSARLALTPHHLFYLLSRFEELGIAVGPMKVRLENLHDTTTAANYVSFLGDTQRSRSRESDVGSIRSVSSVRSVMSGMSALWASLGIGASISAARTERQKAAVQSDLKYLYSAFTKIPCLRLAPDWRARLIRGYEEFPFDSAVPLYVFKNLQALEVSSIDFRQFFGWDRVADQLRSLTLKRAGIEDPADILIDIVLDDMDKRRRRTSKTQSSPGTTWGFGGSSRRGSVVPPPELQRSMTAPGLGETRLPPSEVRVGSLTPSEHAIEDSSTSDTTRSYAAVRTSDELSKSPAKSSRPRSNSPSRPNNGRSHSNQLRSSQQRIRRSGSGSSNSSLSESWHHHGRGSSSGNVLVTGILPATKWRFLRHLSLADNAMTSILPTSLAPLSNTLYSLDISSNLFTQIPDSLATLTALRALNLSHCMIDSLQSLTRNPLPAITALNLRGNRLSSLAGVEKLYPLERLDLRDNHLTDPSEIARLTGIPDIREIWVEGNPFTRTHKDYRIAILNLFRKTPGYTDDIIIDGAGPGSNERRYLVERPPVPESVPVVKPKAPEVPTVDVAKPTIVYGSPQSPSSRRERPVPRAVMSEINTGSTRRKKTPKRRIVDLATNDLSAPLPGDVRSTTSPIDRSSAITPEGNYQVAPKPPQASTATPPADAYTSATIAPAAVPRGEQGTAVRPVPQRDCNDSRPNWQSGQSWDSDAQSYRLKIETLRDKVGDGYLSVLGDSDWDSRKSIAPGQEDQLAHSLQALQGGRTLGQSVSP
ncbi:uncharacterized protein F5Z01DRAFT_671748 [Emericellopsis atlantica]|uniref:Uncharacterized protein n=1 Tax=Emericellopsis atlantica TaxID=2614577 RepID=A0A9P7ZT59_9HYPO|nr:uncharacterized protein F5Z01DRAFT_671748 [Emericellopsis atlantica]KAG9257312.1 hypothetical protein F5Z01DRAFT_671748 [Emericellopsis atlantica]